MAASRNAAPDLGDLLGSWELHLRAERKSPQTVKSYGDGVRAYLTWCADTGRAPQLDRRQLREFVDGLLTAGAKPATAVARHSPSAGSPHGWPRKASRTVIHSSGSSRRSSTSPWWSR